MPDRFRLNPFLYLVPLPGCDSPLGQRGTVTIEWAERWLREDFGPWSLCARWGYNCDDAETRDAFALFSGDLAMLTELSLYVRRTRRAKHVERGDFDEAVNTNLGRVVAWLSSVEAESSQNEAFGTLAAFLSSRLLATGTRIGRRRAERAA